MAGIFLGVDAGGTKTEALVLDEAANVLGHARTGPANYHLVGIDQAVENLAQAAREALSGRTPTGAVFGVSGADLPDDYELLEERLAAALGHPFTLVNDTEIALRSGTDDVPAGVLVLGTGANTAVRMRHGWLRIHAMGYETGTGGGAKEMVRTILHAAFQAAEGTGPDTSLRRSVLTATGKKDYDALAALFRESDALRHEVLRQAGVIVPLAFEAARDGDEVAQDIIVQHGSSAGKILAGLLAKAQVGTTEVAVVLAGGLFSHAHTPLLRDAVALEVHRAAPAARIGVLSMPPVFGAAVWATGFEDERAAEFRRAFAAHGIPEG